MMKLLRLAPVGLALLLTAALLAFGAHVTEAGGPVNTCDDAHLAAALSGGGLVTFNCGAATLSVTTVKSIAANTTIDGLNGGSPLTLTASSGVQLFAVQAGAMLTLANITVAGVNYYNAPISVQSGAGLFITNSRFLTNTDHVVVAYGPVTVTNSYFSENGGGPALYINGSSLDVSNSQFISNTTGAIGNGGTGQVVIANSQFITNSMAYAQTGVVNVDAGVSTAGPLTVTASSFVGNLGADIYDSFGRVYISDTQFISTVARYTALNLNNPGVVQVISSTFRANQVGGIGVNSGSSSLYVVDSQFVDNSGPNSIGGITAGTITLSNSIFVDNHVTANNWAGGLTAGGFAYITGSLFIGNSGPQAGAMILSNAGSPAFVDVIANTRVLSNTSLTYGGGGAHTFVPVAISDSEFSGNIAQAGDGGGLLVIAPGNPVTVTRSLFSHNVITATSGTGGGLNLAANAALVNSTVYSNSAPSAGGLYVQGTAALTNVTLINNTATGLFQPGGNLHNGGVVGAVSLFNTIVANGGPSNCGGSAILSLGHNLGTDGSCQITATGDLSGTPALLGPFQNNGGPTWSLMPLPASLAVNGGSNAGCPADDQRGVARPLAGICDIGAVESPFQKLHLYLPLIMR